jgi:hypothetical protein
MTRSVLLLIGGVLAVSALSFYSAESPNLERSFAASVLPRENVAASGVFVPNLGEVSSDAIFYLRHTESVLLLKATDIQFEAPESADSDNESGIHFVGANNASKVVGLAPLKNITGFRAVRYEGLYDGVDLHLDASSEDLSGHFTLEAGIDPGVILFVSSLQDHEQLKLTEAFQEIDGRQISIVADLESARYGATALDVGVYDERFPVQIGFEIGI